MSVWNPGLLGGLVAGIFLVLFVLRPTQRRWTRQLDRRAGELRLAPAPHTRIGRLIERFARALMLLLCVFAVAVPPASATCRWEWDCSETPCRHAQVCDSTIDLPAIRPPAIAPIVPPAIRPIPQPVVPPIGTTQCRPVRLCDSWGRCAWETVCR